MKRKFLISLLFILGILTLSACKPAISPPITISTQGQELNSIPTPTQAWPVVEGPVPSNRIVAFYYPWYQNVSQDGRWIHWNEGGFFPPLDISSDFFPLLGAYSSFDTLVVAQHFAWLRQAGVGVIATSWWGKGSNEDKAVPLLLEMGEKYGIKVAFHIEPYGGRSADSLISDIRYLYDRYGTHPAFFRTTATSRWSSDKRPKGLFFLWASRYPDSEKQPVEADYWREAMDSIHGLPDGGLVIADEIVSEWVDGGHFDGLYNYAVLETDKKEAYTWARSLPPDAWYIPGVNPGFSAVRIGYDKSTYVPRRDGAAYEERWQASLDTGVEPAMIAITSFNEWHEGTQIEPAAAGANNGHGHTYDNYGILPSDGYLAITRKWVNRFSEMTWTEAYKARIRLVTSSDWTTFGLIEGADWLRPGLVFASSEADYAGSEDNRFLLTQSFSRAQSGKTIEMIVDILINDTRKSDELVFEVERGHLGSTFIEIINLRGDEPVVVASFNWDGIAPGERNAQQIRIPITTLLEKNP